MLSDPVLRQIPVADIKVEKRLRQVDESKVLELMQSFEEVGIINPISVDQNMVLIAGAHRLASAKNLDWKTIEAKIFDDDELNNLLIQVSENLFRNDLCYIGIGEHIQERERILTSLGHRKERGSNQYSDDDDLLSTDDLAQRIGVSNKTYRQQRQVADLPPDVRNALRGTDHGRKNLNDLLNLTRQKPAIQKRVAELVKEDPKQSLRLHIDVAHIELNTDKDKSALVRALKEKWGVPFSVMKFDRENHELSKICRQVTMHDQCRVIRGDVTGREMPNYSGFIDHSLFLLEYFVRKPKSRCVDNFCGKGTNLIAGLALGMEMHGFDLNPRLIDRIQDVVDEHMPDGNLTLYNDSGVDMKPLENETETFDCVISDPPYLNCPDVYTDDPEDLSNMNQSKFEEMMRKTFSNYYRLIKRSSVKDKTFYPLMLRMTSDPTEEFWTEAMGEAIERNDKSKQKTPIEQGSFHPVIMKMNASRRAETGMVSMDFIIARIAEEQGFSLWDRTFNTLAPASASVSNLRNYDFHYTHKNWETTLIWIKQ